MGWARGGDNRGRNGRQQQHIAPVCACEAGPPQKRVSHKFEEVIGRRVRRGDGDVRGLHAAVGACCKEGQGV